MRRVYLGLGSNVSPEHYLRLGVRELRRRFGGLDVSSVYRSKAVGFDGEDFLNLVVGCDTADSPAAVHGAIEHIHSLAGRKRAEQKFADRTLDIDLLLYGDLILDDPDLQLPRRDILEYSFVLRPLAEIAPGVVHPLTGRTIADHWNAFDAGAQPLKRVDLAF